LLTTRHDHAVAAPGAVEGGTTRPAADAAGHGASAVDEVDEMTGAIEGARRGDSGAFRILYRETQPRLLRYLSYLVGGEAEDIASETWLQASRDLGRFSGGQADFRGWITTIARNRAMDHLRRATRQPPAVPVPVEDLAFVAGREDTADRAIEAITTEQALTLIASLPPDQAEAVLLRAVVGLDAKGAARVAGKRAGAIRTAAYRGLKTIEKRIEQRGDGLGLPATVSTRFGRPLLSRAPAAPPVLRAAARRRGSHPPLPGYA
jgi:RNA polymerase sigma-70 factor (ECF subfamily)